MQIFNNFLYYSRQPYELKAPMQLYNVFQVLLSAYIAYEAWMAGWGTHYSWGKIQEHCMKKHVDCKIIRKKS